MVEVQGQVPRGRRSRATSCRRSTTSSASATGAAMASKRRFHPRRDPRPPQGGRVHERQSRTRPATSSPSITTSTREVARSAVRNLTTSRTQGIPYWGAGQIHLEGMKRMIEVQRMVGAHQRRGRSRQDDRHALPARRHQDAEMTPAARGAWLRSACRAARRHQGLPASGGRAAACTRSARSISTSRRGEFFAVVGPSGCGKSTLLELIAGSACRRPTARVEFEGRPIAAEIPDGIGVVFQEDACFPWLTCRGQRRLRPAQGRARAPTKDGAAWAQCSS